MAEAEPSDILSVSDAARHLGVSPRQVRNLITGGTLPAQIVGGSYMIRRSDLAKVPAERKPGPKPAAEKPAKPAGRTKPAK